MNTDDIPSLNSAPTEGGSHSMNTYLSTDFLDTPEISSLLFHPRRCDAANKLAPMSISVPGAELGGLWFDNPSSDDVVLFFHGNGEVAADWASMASDYAVAFDASLWFIDYRGYGKIPGKPSYGNMLADAEAAFSALSNQETERGRPFRRRYVFGRSIGSAPAIHMAWRFPDHVAALVIDSGFTRVTELVRRFREMRGLSGGAPSAPDGFLDNVDKLRSCRMPTLLIHGVIDKLIPVSEARENLEASAASGKRLVEIPGAGHNDLIFKSRLDGSYFGAIPFVVAK